MFAIIITLLVLDLRVPRESGVAASGLAAALGALWPNYLAYVVSFCIVAVVWANHHTMFRYIRRTDHTLIVLWFGISGPWLARRLTRPRPSSAYRRPPPIDG